jgi:hypothetical protein
MTRPRAIVTLPFVTTDWRYSGAFVLQLGPGTDLGAGRLVGRLEHVASTQSARFGSLDELLAALRDMLADASRPGPGGGPSKRTSDSASHPPGAPLGGDDRR